MLSLSNTSLDVACIHLDWKLQINIQPSPATGLSHDVSYDGIGTKDNNHSQSYDFVLLLARMQIRNDKKIS